MAVAFMPRAWAKSSWYNYHADVKDVNVGNISYQICHTYKRSAGISDGWFGLPNSYRESSTNLEEDFYASILSIDKSGEVEVPDTIVDAGVKYAVKYIGLKTIESVTTETPPNTETCSYYTTYYSIASVTAANVTKLTFKGNIFIKGTFSAQSCSSMEFKKNFTISADLNCSQLSKLVFGGVFNYSKNNNAYLRCPNLQEIYFKGMTPALSGNWSDYSTAVSASNVTVYVNESQDVCDYMHEYSTVWSNFKAIYALPGQARPMRNISITINGGRVQIGDSPTYILQDANYQVEQFSAFTFHVTKLYGSDYLVKSVKINGEEMLDAMTLTQKLTDALSYYSYTISPVINDVHISVEGESIYDRASAICSAGGTCRWSTQSLSTITPNENSSVRWLKSSEVPPSLIIIPDEGFTLDRFFYNNYDNTYRVTSNEDGTYEYQVAADAKVSVVFKEKPATTTWNVSLLNNEQAVSVTMMDKRNDEYRYTLTNGENAVLDKPKSITMRIDGAGTPLVQADGVDLSSCFELTSEWLGEMDEYGNMITEDYYSGTIPSENLETKNWVIGLREETQHVWTSALKSEAEGGSFTLSGGNLAEELNLSSDDREGVFVDNASNPTIVAGFSLTSTVVVPKGYAFTVMFNDTDLSSYYAYGSTTESASSYQAVFDGSQSTLSALIGDGAWTIEFKKSTADIIEFADAEVKRICVENWDTDRDGELSKAEAAAVTTLKKDNGDGTFGDPVFMGNTTITSFDELQYFTELTSVEENAFFKCTNLTSVIVPKNVKTIEYQAFLSCKYLSVVLPEGLTKIGVFAFGNCSYMKKIKLPESLERIERSAFADCFTLNALYIPKNVNFINFHNGALTGLSGLLSIVVDPENATYDSRNGCNAIIVTATNELKTGCRNTIIPEGVTSLYGFVGQYSMTSIEIPASVKSIIANAFLRCRNLTSVVSHIENPVAFGENAFGSISPDCVLTVPCGTRQAYIDAGWTEEIFKGGIVEAPSKYDVNEDGSVSISDVTKLVNKILGRE